MKTFAAATLAATLCATTAEAVTVDLVATLRAGDPAAEAFFGFDIALDGTTALIAAPFGDGGAPGASGAAYLVDLSGPVPVQSVIAPPPGLSEGGFGTTVAIDGDRALVSNVASAFDRDTDEVDSIIVYDLSGAAPAPVGTLTASDGRPGDQFGFSLAIDGDRAVVGADSAIGTKSANGAAYVYDLGGPAPVETAKLVPFDAVDPDDAGNDVAIEGDTVLVGTDGAVLPADIFGDQGGAAYLYDLGETPPGEVAAIRSDDPSVAEGFGVSVDLDDGVALIGSFAEENSASGLGPGRAYLIDTRGDPSDPASRRQLGAEDGSPGDAFGQSVALDDGIALIGAPRTDGRSGAAYIFDALTGRQLARIDAPNGADEQLFGQVVALSGNLALVSSLGGGPSGNRNPSAVYVYRIEQPARIPLPAPALLLVGAMGALVLVRRRR